MESQNGNEVKLIQLEKINKQLKKLNRDGWIWFAILVVLNVLILLISSGVITF